MYLTGCLSSKAIFTQSENSIGSRKRMKDRSSAEMIFIPFRCFPVRRIGYHVSVNRIDIAIGCNRIIFQWHNRYNGNVHVKKKKNNAGTLVEKRVR